MSSRPLRAASARRSKLDGCGLRGATAFGWAQTTGAAVALAGTNMAVATFAPTVAGPAAFTLTVQGVGGPKTTVAAVTVNPPLPADQLAVDQAQYRRNSAADRFIPVRYLQS